MRHVGSNIGLPAQSAKIHHNYMFVLPTAQIISTGSQEARLMARRSRSGPAPRGIPTKYSSTTRKQTTKYGGLAQMSVSISLMVTRHRVLRYVLLSPFEIYSFPGVFLNFIYLSSFFPRRADFVHCDAQIQIWECAVNVPSITNHNQAWII
jgi:hypothetical protein